MVYCVQDDNLLPGGKEASMRAGYLGVLPKKKPKPEHEENKFMFKVLLHNGLSLTLQLEDVVEKMLIT